jgi:uncharacterized protein (TIGR03083 family)
VDLSPQDLVEIGFDALESAPEEIPGDAGRLGARILAAARSGGRSSRHPGWAATAHQGLTPLGSFGRTAAELGNLLGQLSAAEWGVALPIPDGTPRDLIRHVTGIERYLLGQLGRGEFYDAPTREDHYPVSRRATADLAGASAEEVARAWWVAVLALISAAAELGPDQPVAFHHLPGTMEGLLVVRTFELWTHADDIRRGTGRPLDRLDGPRLALMSSQLMNVLGLGMALLGTAQSGRTARIILSGPGAGEFDLPLAPDEAPGDPDITLRTSALDLCRLAANRLAFADLQVEVSGDRALLEPILVGATAFAAD